MSLRRPRAIYPDDTTRTEGHDRQMPTVSQVLRHGDLGVGVVAEGRSEIVILGGRCYTVATDFTIAQTDAHRKIRSAAIIKFEPEFRLALRQPLDLSQVLARITRTLGDDETMGAFCVTGWFSFVGLGANRPAGGGLGGVGFAERPPTIREFSDVTGTVVGLHNVDVGPDSAGDALRLFFIDEHRRFGGCVTDFESLQAHVDLAPIDRVSYRA
ncbi:MAG: alpha-acetolactate decarboxylase [Glaciihabitans sp.]|nr:alpha-acetolactate decarboxylase [Glaciihabitans sp.]